MSPDVASHLPVTIWSVLNDLPVAIYIKDADSKFIWLNRAAAAALGADSVEDAIGKSDRDFFCEEVANEWIREEEEIIRTGKSIIGHREQELLKNDGVAPATVVTSKIRYVDAAGRYGIIGVSNSINTEQEIIRRSDAAIAGAQVGLWYSDERSGKVWFSPRWKEILGHTDQTLANSKEEFWKRVHPDDLEKINAARARHLADPGRQFECEFRMRHESDGWRWIRSRGTGVFRDGQMLEFAGSHNDVTAYKDQNELHEAILKMLPVLVFLKDQDLKFSFVNEELVRFFNRPREQIVGFCDRDINSNVSQTDKFEQDDRTVLTGSLGSSSLIIEREELLDQERKENRILTTQKRLICWPSRDERKHVLGISTDITTLVQALESRRRMLEDERNKFRAILDELYQAGETILDAENEDDACANAVLYLDSLAHRLSPGQQTGVMLSFLHTKEELPYVEAMPSLTTGVFSEIAPFTLRPMFGEEGKMDILPWVLQTGETMFVADSTQEPRCDRALAEKHGLRAQLIIPLRTRSFKIGTLQVALGNAKNPPYEKSAIETIARNLSSTIERHRRLAERTEKNRQLLRASQLAAYSAAGTTVIHGLKHNLSQFRILLERTERDKTVRSCAPAMDFLKDCRRFADGWAESFADQLVSARSTSEDNYTNLPALIRDLIEFHYEAGAFDCKVEGDFEQEQILVPGKQLYLRESFSALMINAAEAHAKKIKIAVDVIKTILPYGGVERTYARARVSDDGDGIASEYQDQIGQFGWTSKKKRGHGVGLTIVSTFAESLEGGLFLRSGGRSVGESETVFELFLPLAETSLHI